MRKFFFSDLREKLKYVKKYCILILFIFNPVTFRLLKASAVLVFGGQLYIHFGLCASMLHQSIEYIVLFYVKYVRKQIRFIRSIAAVWYITLVYEVQLTYRHSQTKHII